MVGRDGMTIPSEPNQETKEKKIGRKHASIKVHGKRKWKDFVKCRSEVVVKCKCVVVVTEFESDSESCP